MGSEVVVHQRLGLTSEHPQLGIDPSAYEVDEASLTGL